MSENVIKGNVGELFVLSTGEIKEPKNLDKFHPQSNVNVLIINIEGIPQQNTMAQINFAPNNRKGWSSSWFPLFRRGNFQHRLSNEEELRTFTQYTIQVPEPITSLNLNSREQLNVGITFRHIGGVEFLGAYDNLDALKSEHPASEELSLDLAVAYVYGNGEQGFYQVAFDDPDYEWELTESPNVNLAIKPYNMGDIKIQGGYGSRKPIQTLLDAQYQLIWLELSRLNSELEGLDVNFENVELELGQHKTDPLAHGDIRQDIQDLDDNKVDKLTNAPEKEEDVLLYGLDSEGNQIGKLASKSVQKDTIVLRTDDGEIADLELHDENIKAHETLFDSKVDKVETPTVDPVIERVYGTKHDGTQTTFQLTNLELQPNTIVKRNENGKIYDLEAHDGSATAHADIRTMLQAVRGAFVYRGKANFTTEYLRQYTGELSSIIISEYGRDAVMGDVLVDLDEVEWYFNGDNWFEYGQGQIALATALNDGLLGKEDYDKIQTMYGNLNWDSDRGSVIDPIAFKLIRLGVDQSINDYIANNQVYNNTRYTYFKNDFSSIVGESIGDLIIQSGGAGLTPEQEAKLDIIKDDGDGTKVLADDGTYKEVSGGSIDEVDGATTPIMLKTGSQETLDEDDTLKERELVYSSDKNIFGIYYDNKIRWQGDPLVIEPIIRVRSFGASDSKLSYVGMSPTLRLLQDGDINYYTNDIFDTMYPFRDMKEVEDELGNKFIEIPPFYVKYIVDENNIITGYDIANYKVDEDYGISQAFIDVISGEVKPLWFGKYMANVDGSDKMTSKSGVMADASKTLAWFRERARNTGFGYYQNSLYTWQIVQMLMWTYFGSINSDDFFPDINYGNYLNNGQMDSVPYKVAYNSTTGKNTFFGIENILKEKRHFIDGVLLNRPNMYVAKDFRKFATDTTTNYDLVSSSLPSSSNYIVAMAFENGVMYPKVVSGGSDGTYFADYYYQGTGNRILYGGSSRGSHAILGLSYWHGDRDSSYSIAFLGSRLMYSPLTPTE